MAAGEPRNVWNLAAELGEGPVWVERDRALWFVDIKKRQVHRFDPASDDKRSFTAPEQVGFILPAERGGFVAGQQSGLHHFDETSGKFELIVEVEPYLPNNRLNDGVVDPQGRLWFGTMDDSERAKTGAFYCFAEGVLTKTAPRRSGLDLLRRSTADAATLEEAARLGYRLALISCVPEGWEDLPPNQAVLLHREANGWHPLAAWPYPPGAAERRWQQILSWGPLCRRS